RRGRLDRRLLGVRGAGHPRAGGSSTLARRPAVAARGRAHGRPPSPHPRVLLPPRVPRLVLDQGRVAGARAGAGLQRSGDTGGEPGRRRVRRDDRSQDPGLAEEEASRCASCLLSPGHRGDAPPLPNTQGELVTLRLGFAASLALALALAGPALAKTPSPVHGAKTWTW